MHPPVPVSPSSPASLPGPSVLSQSRCPSLPSPPPSRSPAYPPGPCTPPRSHLPPAESQCSPIPVCPSAALSQTRCSGAAWMPCASGRAPPCPASSGSAWRPSRREVGSSQPARLPPAGTDFPSHVSPPSLSPGLDVDGIYRVSGNLSVIQKLRFAVDRGEGAGVGGTGWGCWGGDRGTVLEYLPRDREGGFSPPLNSPSSPQSEP